MRLKSTDNVMTARRQPIPSGKGNDLLQVLSIVIDKLGIISEKYFGPRVDTASEIVSTPDLLHRVGRDRMPTDAGFSA